MELRKLFTATVPIDGGSLPATDFERAADVVDVLDAAPNAGIDLPCRTNPDLWFADTPAELELAKLRCVDCPVRAECLAGALSRREPCGVWGGEIFERGVVISRKRPRGRPRKTDSSGGQPVLQARESAA